MFKRRYSEFKDELTQATADAWSELKVRTAGEQLYVFALYTSGEADFSYLCASANSREALRDGRTPAGGTWLAPDWKYHDFSARVSQLALPEGRGPRRDAELYEVFLSCLNGLDSDGLFGREAEREQITLLVSCGDCSDDFFRKGLRHLNPAAVVSAYVRDFTPDGFFERIDRLEGADNRLKRIVELYRDLILDRATPEASEARNAHATEYDVERRLVTMGPWAVDRLIELIDEYAMAPAFYEQGAGGVEKYGLTTRENWLATSAVFAVLKCGSVTEQNIEALRVILARRVAADRDLSRTSTLAENIARLLHVMRPWRFPATQVDGRTNHLRNPGPFLP